jgi:pilus assembly protein CpaF
VTARLSVRVTGPEGASEVALTGPGLVRVGRGDDCQIKLAWLNVSRHHASIELTSDNVIVTDTSANGSTLDGTALFRSARTLTNGRGTLAIGPYQLRIEGGALGATRLLATPTPPQEPQPEPAVGPRVEIRRAIRRRLLEHLDLAGVGRTAIDPDAIRPKVVAALRRILADSPQAVPAGEARETLVRDLADEALGLGPLERLLSDESVSEIMVVDPHTIFVEKRGRLERTSLAFTDDDAVRAVIERIVTPLGRRIDESTPLVDARLRDGSRVNAVIPPLAIRGPCITIRKFAKTPLAMADLVRFGSMSEEMAEFLERSVKVKKNIVISGGTGSGKTTLLNVLSSAIPAHERVVTVEDAAELRLAQPHVVALESRPPNLEGKGEYSIRDLVKNALRMRPDRIVVGECRGGEAVDMLQAMNTGHDGSLTTTHANNPREAVARIETLCLMAGLDLPARAIRSQIAASVHLIVQQTRFSDGARRISSIAEVTGIDDQGEVELREIYRFKIEKVDALSSDGEFLATGFLPSFLDQFAVHGFLGQEARP